MRHGETEWNAAGRFQGPLDSPLTRRGRGQAAQLGRALATVLGDRSTPLHVSPLGRAQETAAIVSCHIPSVGPALSEPHLREVSTGSWDGLTHQDIDAGWPGAWMARPPSSKAVRLRLRPRFSPPDHANPPRAARAAISRAQWMTRTITIASGCG